jgi:hypothetical protein
MQWRDDITLCLRGLLENAIGIGRCAPEQEGSSGGYERLGIANKPSLVGGKGGFFFEPALLSAAPIFLQPPASRLTARAFGFLLLIQCGERPER